MKSDEAPTSSEAAFGTPSLDLLARPRWILFRIARFSACSPRYGFPSVPIKRARIEAGLPDVASNRFENEQGAGRLGGSHDAEG